eukprot:12650497-Alexandrium_andersonii.AAC.1
MGASRPAASSRSAFHICPVTIFTSMPAWPSRPLRSRLAKCWRATARSPPCSRPTPWKCPAAAFQAAPAASALISSKSSVASSPRRTHDDWDEGWNHLLG